MMLNVQTMNARPTSRGRLHPVHDFNRQIHVDHRQSSLAAEARAERLAAAQRRHHREEHDAHPGLRHAHPMTGVRGTIGRFLIGLGRTIAGSGAGAAPAA